MAYALCLRPPGLGEGEGDVDGGPLVSAIVLDVVDGQVQ
jgi:hypothetical protein